MKTLPARLNRGGAPADQRLRAESTRAALVASARSAFTDVGYHATGTSDVALGAAVSRGALYHHFAGKEELFEAVFHQVLGELNQEARAAVAALSGDPWGQVVGAFTTYLGLIAASQEFQRILLIDGPVVLGWGRWRDLQAKYTATGTAKALRLLMRRGMVMEHPVEPLAYLVQAALNDAALAVAHAVDPQAANVAATNAFVFLLSGLRRGSQPDAA